MVFTGLPLLHYRTRYNECNKSKCNLGKSAAKGTKHHKSYAGTPSVQQARISSRLAQVPNVVKFPQPNTALAHEEAPFLSTTKSSRHRTILLLPCSFQSQRQFGPTHQSQPHAALHAVDMPTMNAGASSCSPLKGRKGAVAQKTGSLKGD